MSPRCWSDCSTFLENGNILGIDICGECQQGFPLPEYLQAEELNEETNQKLFEFLSHYIL